MGWNTWKTWKDRSLTLAAPWVVALACQPPVNEVRPTVSLRVAGAPADASVTIDEKTIGTFDYVAARGVALPPGVHHITVKAEGYFPWDREVEAKLGDPPIRLQVALIPVPD